MEETFTAGVRIGGLTEGREIRILICHLLSEVEEPIALDEMIEAIVTEGEANYFEFTHALAELCESGCVLSFNTEAGIPVYTATQEGKAAAEALVRDIPLSVKERVTANAKNILRRRRIEKENLVSIIKTEDGFRVHMRVTDIGTDLMELSLFMPTEEQANSVKERFLEDPAGSYLKVLENLAGEF